MKCENCGNEHARHLWINFKATRNDEELVLDEKGKPIRLEHCENCEPKEG
jgi:hypothetical protein